MQRVWVSTQRLRGSARHHPPARAEGEVAAGWDGRRGAVQRAAWELSRTTHRLTAKLAGTPAPDRRRAFQLHGDESGEEEDRADACQMDGDDAPGALAPMHL